MLSDRGSATIGANAVGTTHHPYRSSLSHGFLPRGPWPHPIQRREPYASNICFSWILVDFLTAFFALFSQSWWNLENTLLANKIHLKKQKTRRFQGLWFPGNEWICYLGPRFCNMNHSLQFAIVSSYRGKFCVFRSIADNPGENLENKISASIISIRICKEIIHELDWWRFVIFWISTTPHKDLD